MKSMRLILALGIVLSWSMIDVHADTFGRGDNQFELEFVTVGDPGNPPDTTDSDDPAGAVDYVYRIGKFEISREMIEKANAEGDLGITLDSMELVTGGPRSAMPATGISWNEAARFANWLNTSQGFSPAYKFSTQPGETGYDANAHIELWVAGDAGFDVANGFRNSQARYFLPSEDEWYKAAYYDPSANNGTGGYWEFPSGSNTVPAAVASGTDPSTAVYRMPPEHGPADVDQAGGLNPQGTMAQGGNVWEWEEGWIRLRPPARLARGLRGGNWISRLSDNLAASGHPVSVDPDFEGVSMGLRVASIPEPSSCCLAIVALFSLLACRGRRSN